MSLNRLSPNSDLSTDGGRGQLNETLELMAAEIRRLKQNAAGWEQWAAATRAAQGVSGSASNSAPSPNSVAGSGSEGLLAGSWVSFTPTATWTSNVEISGRYLSLGSLLFVQIRMYILGSVGTPGALSFYPPSGFTPDVTGFSDFTGPHIGTGVMSDADAFFRNMYVTQEADGLLDIWYKNGTGTILRTTHGVPAPPVAADYYLFSFWLPVVSSGGTTGTTSSSGAILAPAPPPPTSPTRFQFGYGAELAKRVYDRTPGA